MAKLWRTSCEARPFVLAYFSIASNLLKISWHLGDPWCLFKKFYNNIDPSLLFCKIMASSARRGNSKSLETLEIA